MLSFNFAAGFAYVAAGIGLLARKAWSAPLAIAIAVATILVFFAFAGFVTSGGAYEARTIAAMALRSTFWIAVAIVAWRMNRTRRQVV